jgi:hypothetical protein
MEIAFGSSSEPTRKAFTREFWVVGAYFRRGRATRAWHPSQPIVEVTSGGFCRRGTGTHSP